MFIRRSHSQTLQVSCHDCGITAEAQKKLCDHVCIKLDHELALTRWDDSLDSTSDFDSGSVTIGTQTQINGVIKFCVLYDITYICSMPMVEDLHDIGWVIRACEYQNVLTGPDT